MEKETKTVFESSIGDKDRFYRAITENSMEIKLPNVGKGVGGGPLGGGVVLLVGGWSSWWGGGPLGWGWSYWVGMKKHRK